MTDQTNCQCGASLELCVKCWDPACPHPVCFACLLTESGMSTSELPELVNAVRPVRNWTAVPPKPSPGTRRVRLAPHARRAS